MFGPAAVAAIAPFLLAISQAATVTTSSDVAVASMSAEAAEVLKIFPCQPDDDLACYKKYYDEKKSCHPYDRNCYRDCDDYNDYESHCHGHDERCYDKCYYWNDGCDRYNECRDDDYGCFKRYRFDNYELGHRNDHFCKPWDWDCHHRDHRDGRYECYPHRDEHCFPDYPDYPDYDHHGDWPHHPQSHITVRYFGPHGSYKQRVWPNGDEDWTDHDHFIVTHIKYYAERHDRDVLCLPMKSWFPWTPLPIERYIEEREEHGLKVRTIRLKHPQPVEVIRCDFP